jgi:hypothetical protein
MSGLHRSATAFLFAAVAGLSLACDSLTGGDASPPTGTCDLGMGPRVCPASACGNGRRDVCAVTPPGSGYCSATTIREPCDRGDLGGVTCQGMGYATGTLRCAPTCAGFDASGCSACTPADAVVRCGPAAMPKPIAPAMADIAATDAEIGFTWVDTDDAGVPSALWFGRLSPSLDLIGTTLLDEPALDAARVSGRYFPRVAIAPLPAGWVVAGWTPGGYYLHALDDIGYPVGHTVVEGPTELPIDSGLTNTAPPLFASRPDAAPLLVWAVSRTVYRAAVLSDDGTQMTAPVDIALPVGSNYQLMSATFAGDTFYVLFAFRDGKGTLLARIAPTGELLGVDMLLNDVSVMDPFFVDGADQPRIVYRTWTNDGPPDQLVASTEADVGWALVAQELGPSGAAPSAPHYVTSDGGAFQWIRGLAFGGDTFLMLNGSATQPPRLAAARVAADGATITSPYDVANGAAPVWLRTVRRGPDAIIAWFGDPIPLNVALVRP